MSRPEPEPQLGRRLVLELGDHPHERAADLLRGVGVDVAAVQPADVVGLEDLGIGDRGHRARGCYPAVDIDPNNPAVSSRRSRFCAAAGAPGLSEHRVDPQAAGRDRRAADRLARDPDLHRAGVRAVPAAHRVPGRADRGVHRRRALACGRRRRMPADRGGHAHRRSAVPRGAGARRARRSAQPMPTASPTSTSTRCSPSTAATAPPRR